MKIFVTGATGFIGREFCRAAIAAGHQVLALCRGDSSSVPGGCEIAAGPLSVVPWREIERFGPDAALHLAWIATPGTYLQSPENEVLVGQSEALFRGLAERGVAHIAGTGTCIEYAPSTAPLREDAPQAPAFPYSRAKVETCSRLKLVAEQFGVAWSWFRVFYPYGAGEHRDRMPSSLMQKLRRGDTVELKTPDSVKDYVHVSDVAQAMLRSFQEGLTSPINAGSGTGIRIADLARMIATIVGASPDRILSASPCSEDPFPVVIADTSRLRTAGWNPRTDLLEGLEHLAASIRH